MNFEWHLAIARASRNEPPTALMEAISTPVIEATGDENVTTPATRREAVAAHGRVMAAVGRGDAKAAAEAMQAHLTAYTSLVKPQADRPAPTPRAAGSGNLSGACHAPSTTCKA
ncbi:hypothetical protein BH23PSE1_BH23PSE1_02390 [soil metagenome]